MAIKLRCLDGMALLRAMLRRIEVARGLFMLDIQQGEEAFILPELSQDQLPYSMRYYDSIIVYLQENID